MSTTTPPRIALCKQNVTITWADATPFNGFVLINLLIPNAVSGTNWTEVDYGTLFPALSLPQMQIIPIIGGQYNGSCGLFLNADLVPPGSQYRVYVYDSTKRQIAGPSSNFSVTTTDAIDPIAAGGGLTLTNPSGVQAGLTPD